TPARTSAPRRTSSWRRGSGRWFPPASRSPSPRATRHSCTRAPGSPPSRVSAWSTRQAPSTPATAARSRSSSSTWTRATRSGCAAATASPNWSSSGSRTRSSSRSPSCPARRAPRAGLDPPAVTATMELDPSKEDEVPLFRRGRDEPADDAVVDDVDDVETPRPARPGGPYDVDDVDDELARLDLGAMRVPVPDGCEVRVDVQDEQVVAATIVDGRSALQIHA